MVELQKTTRVPTALTIGNSSEQVNVIAENELLQSEDSVKGKLISGALKLVASGTTSPSGFSLGNANFGDLTADRGGRVLQLAARFVF